MPAEQRASGTALLPGETPMHAVHLMSGLWSWMLHGNGFVQYLDDGGARGANQFGAINWFMAMARRRTSRGAVGVNAMISVEPLSIRGCGYPDLLATGERCADGAIVDRQHPHDLIMELTGSYERAIADGVVLQLYGGPAGEPALGPVAFPHRLSAGPNPIAPISHHWLDATHITFGVATAALRGRKWKAEGSVFNGREPDEDRYGLDLAPLDSMSGRVWFVPTERLTFQLSAGRLNDAEPSHDDGSSVDVSRLTASATYHRFAGDRTRFWATTLAWGRNVAAGQSADFGLAETSVTIRDRHAWFGRIELGAKDGHDLGVDGMPGLFALAKLQAGYARYFKPSPWLRSGVGGVISASVVTTMGLGVFVIFSPGSTRMAADDPHAGHVMP
jgi:hypothetical protein